MAEEVLLKYQHCVPKWHQFVVHHLRPYVNYNGVMKTVVEHLWNLQPAEARALQNRLRELVHVSRPKLDVNWIAGVDVGISGATVRAAVVVLSYPALDLVEVQAVDEPLSFPYVPGLLSFREAPALLHAAQRVRQEPDLIFVDGHGFAHPRRFGIASHLGVLLDKPTIGVAKSRLVGQHEVPGPSRGDRAPLMHEGEVIGAVLRTGPRKPTYVSIGHRVDLAYAIELCLATTRQHRLPEPIRLAHQAASGTVSSPKAAQTIGKGTGG